MIVDILACFRQAGIDIKTAFDAAYPSNGMDIDKANVSLAKIDGINSMLKTVIKNRIKLAKEEETKLISTARSLESDWKPSMEADFEVLEECSPLPKKRMQINCISFLDRWTKIIESSVFWTKKVEKVQHAALQGINSSVSVLNAFLDSIDEQPKEQP